MIIGILIGRFQPLHKGHVKAIKFSIENSNKLFIIIGSSEKSHQERNPFTFEEREKMIELALSEEKLDNKIEIVPIKDAKNHSEWILSIKDVIEDYNVVFTNDELTEKLFRKNNTKVVNVTLLDRKNLSSTEVRKRIKSDNKWENLTLPIVADYLVKIDGINRIKSII